MTKNDMVLKIAAAMDMQQLQVKRIVQLVLDGMIFWPMLKSWQSRQSGSESSDPV